MASAPNAKVICLQSHPAWAAAERRARERMEAMRRHPSFQSRLPTAVLGKGVGARGGKRAVVPELRVCRGEMVLDFPPRNHIC
jgi:hypothetical protein